MKRILPILLTALVASAACTKQQVQSYYDKQQTNIDDFVSALLESGKAVKSISKGHAIRIVLKEGTTADSLATNGTVSFYYAGYTLSGKTLSNSSLFSTNSKAWADDAKWKVTADDEDYRLLTLKLDEAPLLEGLRDGLAGVKGGEECYIVFLGKYGFGNAASGTIPAKSTLVYRIAVDSFQNE